MDCSMPGSSVHGILQAMIQDGLPCPPPGDFPNPGIEPMSPALQADSLPTWEAYMKKLSTGTCSKPGFLPAVLLFHSSSPKNICTLWPFNSLQCGTGASLYFTGDTSESSVVAPCAQCILGAWEPSTNSKLAASQVGCPRTYKRNVLCLVLNVAPCSFVPFSTSQTLHLFLFFKMPLYSSPISCLAILII